MKFFIAVLALVAAVVAEPEADHHQIIYPFTQYSTNLGYQHVVSPYQVPYTYGNFRTAVPQDTAAVKQAKVEHFAAKQQEYAKKGFVYQPHFIYKREADAQFYYPKYEPISYNAQKKQVKYENSGAVVPEDTMAVKLAKAQHFQAKAMEYLKKPIVYTHQPAAVYTHQPAAVYSHIPAVYNHHMYKREAESYYPQYYTNSYYQQYPFNTYMNNFYQQPYTTFAHGIHKRDAEAYTPAQMYAKLNGFNYQQQYPSFVYSNYQQTPVYGYQNMYKNMYGQPIAASYYH